MIENVWDIVWSLKWIILFAAVTFTLVGAAVKGEARD